MVPVNSVSVVIPLLDEEPNLEPLYSKLSAVLPAQASQYEMVFVDDGSTDGSVALLRSLYDADPEHVRIIELRRNFGKTAALAAGFHQAVGDIIVTMDADLQDEPAELPGMLAALEQGYDLVMAWRQDRKDTAGKKRSSLIFNAITSRLTGVSFHDLNCGYKVYRREVIESIRLYSDLHRFIPVLAAWRGFRVTEVPVMHNPRHAGKSKYGYGRIARGMMDLLMVMFVTRYMRYPLRLFGWLGIGTFLAGMAINSYLGVLWMIRFLGISDIPAIGTRPLLSVGVLATLIGIQFFSMGLLGEMVRYFNYRPQQEYSVRRTWP